MLQVKYNININIEFIHESFPVKFSSIGTEDRRERMFLYFRFTGRGAETFLGLNLYSDGDGEQNCRAKQQQQL